MNDELFDQTTRTDTNCDVLRYIETPRTLQKPQKIDELLAKRMREFILARRQRQWMEIGE